MEGDEPPTIGGTVLKESDDLVILGVTFGSKMTLEKLFARFPEQLLKRLVIDCFSISMIDFHDRLLIGRCLCGFILHGLEHCS